MLPGYNESKILDMVNLVILNKFKIPMLEKEERVINKEKKNEVLVEPKKEFKGILTELVTNELVKTPEQNVNFIKLIVSVITNGINLYKKGKYLPNESILFLYKGGNVLRFLFQNITKEFPLSVSKNIESFYADFFKKSDADFSIYIDPRLPNYTTIYTDICNLTFLLENHIRNIFMEHKCYYFEYFKLNDDMKKKILETYLNKLNNSNTIKEKKFGFDGKFTGLIMDDVKIGTNDYYNYKDDSVIAYTDTTTREFKYSSKLNYLQNIKNPDTKLLPLIKEQQEIFSKHHNGMFISANEISFGSDAYVVFFNLIRTKYEFNAIFKYNNNITKEIDLDGELIDISIISKEDSYILHFFEHLHDNYSVYNVGNDLQFNSPSITYLIEDLEKILFTASEFPWDDSKYVKRIKRLLFMYFMILLTNFEPSDKQTDIKLLYLRYIENNIVKVLLNDSLDSDGIVKKQLINYFNDFPKNFRANPFRNLLKCIGKILLNPNTNQEEFKKFILVIDENINKMIEIILSMYNYIDSKGAINEGQLLSTNTLSGGDYYNKYMKYKQKYIQSKF